MTANVPTDLNLPHASIWPVILSAGIAALCLGILMGGLMLPLGALLFLAAGLGWLHEDVQFYRDEISTGERNGWYCTILFLCTEVMIFGGLFATYFRASSVAESWPPIGTPELPVLSTGINTLVLLASGVTMHWAHHHLRLGNKSKFNWGMVATILLGSAFLTFQLAIEYPELIHHGLTLQTAPYGSVFYLLTGTHGLHVFAGIVFLAIVLVRSLMGQFDAERHVAVEAAAIYWHFVDAVWVIVYAIIYLGIG